MKRHTGKILSTDQRCVVTYMQIPGRETHALVIPTDSLPPRMEQAIMEILESDEGQGEETLGNVLARRLMPDTGLNVLQTLHESNLLTAVPVSQIIMLPKPNMAFPLSKVLETMGRAAPDASGIIGENVGAFEHNAQTEVRSDLRMTALNLIAQASLLEEDAGRIRERAYATDPSLRPAAAKVAPVKKAEPEKKAEPVAAPKKAEPKRKAVVKKDHA